MSRRLQKHAVCDQKVRASKQKREKQNQKKENNHLNVYCMLKRILDHAKNYIHWLKNYCSEFILTQLNDNISWNGGVYNGGISFNHLQLLAGWVHGCFRTRFNRLRDQTAWYIEWRSRASFEVQDKEKWTLAPSSVRWQNPIVPATEIRLLASAAKVHRCVCLFTVTGQRKICPEWSGLDS